MANVSSWVESAFRLPPLLSSLGNRPLALEAFSWGTNFANRLSGLLCYPGTTLTQLRSGTALYSHPPGEEPTESVSVASAADKNFTLLSCCCCCLLILLLPEPNTHNRATSTQKKNSPRSRINPKCQSETAATICGRDVKRQNHAISRTPPPAEIHANLFPASTKKKQQEKEQSKAARRQQVWTEFWATFGPDPEQRTGGRDGRGFHASDSTGTETVWGTLQRTGTGFDEDRTEHRNQRARKCRETHTHTLARDWRKVTAGRKVERMKGRGCVGGQDNHFGLMNRVTSSRRDPAGWHPNLRRRLQCEERF